MYEHGNFFIQMSSFSPLSALKIQEEWHESIFTALKISTVLSGTDVAYRNTDLSKLWFLLSTCVSIQKPTVIKQTNCEG